MITIEAESALDETIKKIESFFDYTRCALTLDHEVSSFSLSAPVQSGSLKEAQEWVPMVHAIKRTTEFPNPLMAAGAIIQMIVSEIEQLRQHDMKSLILFWRQRPSIMEERDFGESSSIYRGYARFSICRKPLGMGA